MQRRVAHHPRTRRSLPGRPVGARSDLATVLGQHAADRLDAELSTISAVTGGEPVVAMLIDELYERGDGPSCSAAKKAEAVFKIAFARRRSWFYAFNSFNRRRSSLEIPGRAPASTWACLTQPRKGVPVDPQLPSVNGQFVVPAGGQRKSPLLDQIFWLVLMGLPPRARACFIR